MCLPSLDLGAPRWEGSGSAPAGQLASSSSCRRGLLVELAERVGLACMWDRTRGAPNCFYSFNQQSTCCVPTKLLPVKLPAPHCIPASISHIPSRAAIVFLNHQDPHAPEYERTLVPHGVHSLPCKHSFSCSLLASSAAPGQQTIHLRRVPGGPLDRRRCPNDQPPRQSAAATAANKPNRRQQQRGGPGARSCCRAASQAADSQGPRSSGSSGRRRRRRQWQQQRQR